MTLTHAPGRSRLLALLVALAGVLGLTLVAFPQAPAHAAAACAAPWSSTAVYTGGQSASYNGDNWSAKWWTQGDIPGNNGQNVWADQGAQLSTVAAEYNGKVTLNGKSEQAGAIDAVGYHTLINPIMKQGS
ncbi:carbohydrate-binding protein, partial [Catenulispora rubra]|uniref:carbohydrate-binding protein n=1 Tax=Catenulispora rubra TaxID=280293 RepID=UPI002B26FBB6